MTEVPPSPDPDEPRGQQPPGDPGRSVVVRRTPYRLPARRTWSDRAASVRANLPELAELARHPAVVATAAATATIGTRVALSILDEVLASRGRPQVARALAPATSGDVVRQVTVVHHVVHHVIHHVAGPGVPPWPITPRW